jgi:cystathionine beta-lyase
VPTEQPQQAGARTPVVAHHSPFDFDRLPDRTGTSSSKWGKYAGRDVLPFWVADMDFHTAPTILEALRARLDRDVLGYTETPASAVEAAQAWLAREYGWHVEPEWVVFVPAIVAGFNMAAQAVGAPGDAVLVPVPVYHPFLATPGHAGREAILVDLDAGNGRRWTMDFERMQAAVTPRTRLLMFCNPQNPTGRVYTRDELLAVSEFCLRNRLVICSDEIHSPLVLEPGARHVPIASLDPGIAHASITLIAPTKAYNIPGVGCGAAIIPDPELRERYRHAKHGLVPSIGPLAYAATEAAWRDTSEWLPQLLAYLRGNRDTLAAAVGALSLTVSHVEGTYLAWIDVRELDLPEPMNGYFEAHGVGFNDGAQFGRSGYVRFNFGCPRSLLQEGIGRFAAAVQARRMVLAAR